MGNSNDFFHLSFICLMDFDFSVIILHFFFTKGLFLKKTVQSMGMMQSPGSKKLQRLHMEA